MDRATLLDAYLANRGTVPFDWGTANCCHYAGSWLQVATGSNPMAPDLARVSSKTSVLRRIAELGGSLEAAITSVLGADSAIPPGLAQVGDLIMLPLPDNGANSALLGICNGRHLCCVAEDGSVVNIPMKYAIRAWKVGRE